MQMSCAYKIFPTEKELIFYSIFTFTLHLQSPFPIYIFSSFSSDYPLSLQMYRKNQIELIPYQKYALEQASHGFAVDF